MTLRTAVLASIAMALTVAACGGGGDRDSSIVSHTPTTTTTPPPTTTITPTLSIEEEQATAESWAATADARSVNFATARARPTNTPRPTPSPPYKLALISGSCVWPVAGSFAECEGFVENLTGQSMENIQAVIIYTDAAGTPLASDSALIDYNPVFPGQQSPWSVIGTYNPRYERWRVEFKEFFGSTILTRDDRP